MSQSWNDFALWEELLNLIQPKSVVEPGNFRGGITTFLGLQSQVRGQATFVGGVVLCDLLTRQSAKLRE